MLAWLTGSGAQGPEAPQAQDAPRTCPELRQEDGAISTPGRAHMSEHWAVGDLCEVEGKGLGVVHFVGEAAPTGGRGGFFLGIALEHALGTHDGAVFGTRYFTCRDGHGVMTSRLEDVKFLGYAGGVHRRAQNPPRRVRSPPRLVRGEYRAGDRVEYHISVS
jgi:hypothetical protein